MSSTWLERTHSHRVVALLVLALALRLILYRDFPAFLTSDSGDYIAAASAILSRLDYAGAGMRDWRLPGYPTFLALVQGIVGSDSQRIVLAQVVLGMITVCLGLVVGRLTGSKLAAELLLLFLAFNPVYLLQDHLIMSEGLFLALLLAMTAVAIWSLQEIVSWPEGVILGILSAACILTRANAVVPCAVLAGGAVLIRLAARGRWLERVGANPAGFALGMFLAAAVGLGAWTYRNIAVNGVGTPFTANGYRNVLIYEAQHGLLDPRTPAMRSFEGIYDPGNPDTIYDLVLALGGHPARAEAIAARIAAEQVAQQPVRYLVEASRSALGFAGFGNRATDAGLDDLYWWFQNIVSDVEGLNEMNAASVFDPEAVFYRYVAWGGDAASTRLWSQSGQFYLRVVRPVVFMLFIVLVAATVARRRLRTTELADVVVLFLAVACLGTMVLHAVSLSDYDRFAVSFDWMVLLAAALAFRRLRKAGG